MPSPSAPKIKTSPYEQVLADVGKRQDLRAQTLESQFEDPLRNLMTPQIMGALGTNPFQTSLAASDRAPLETQFNQAKNSLLNTAQRGGALRSAMSGLERDRAATIGGAANQAKQLGINRALGFSGAAFPNSQTMEQLAMGGLGQANTSANNRLAQNAQMKQQASQSKNSGMGSLAGAGLGAAMML